MEINRNNNLYRRLRKEYVKFVYDDYSFVFLDKEKRELKVSFKFKLVDRTGNKEVAFNPTSTISIPRSFKTCDNHAIENLVFHIGMSELVSYWKVACPPVVEVKPFSLTPSQILWWKNLYYWGMQEFFYVNAINPPNIEEFMNIFSSSDKKVQKIARHCTNTRSLIPIGGGKDSVVTLECMKDLSTDNLGLIINPRGASLGTFQKAGYKKQNLIEIKRELDSKLLELNKDGFSGKLTALNGHTPFSSVLAFYSILAGYLSDTKNIVLSNESSADESTVIGTNINHQYSKSYVFETDFRNYVQKHIWAESNYYSFLRPLNELQIASMFSKYPKHFYEFRSCNAGSKKNIWCGECAKCLFTYIILGPFIEPRILSRIFEKDLFGDKSLRLLFQQLIGITESKPFECVGTIEEVNVALILTLERFYKNIELPALLDYYVNEQASLIGTYKNRSSRLLTEYNRSNNLPVAYGRYIKERVQKTNQGLITMSHNDIVEYHAK